MEIGMKNTQIAIVSQYSSDLITRILVDKLIPYGCAEDLKIYRSIESTEALEDALVSISNDSLDPTVFYIFEDERLMDFIITYGKKHKIHCYDILNTTSKFIGSLIEELNAGTFDNHHIMPYNVRSEYLLFARENDDGKNINSLKEADIIIIGISRTTKTPLSIYLSNLEYKVVNIPLVPEVKVPDELYQIPKSKIVGLTMDPNRLVLLRQERLKSLGLPADAEYGTKKRILKEIEYSNQIMNEIGCAIIDVSSLPIEETADIIISQLNK